MVNIIVIMLLIIGLPFLIYDMVTREKRGRLKNNSERSLPPTTLTVPMPTVKPVPDKRVIIGEGNVKKNLNPPPTSIRPAPPKSQIVKEGRIPVPDARLKISTKLSDKEI